MGERTYTARSKRDPATNSLYLTDVKLITGAGEIMFEAGEAQVSEAQARALQNNPQITLHENREVVFDEPAATIPDPEPPPPADDPPPPADPPTGDSERTAAQEAALAAAREHLESEGVDVPPADPAPPAPDAGDAPPPPAIPVPDGFERTLPDGTPRCLAAKADGEQCSNPEKEPGSGACQHASHQQQVSERAG